MNRSSTWLRRSANATSGHRRPPHADVHDAKQRPGAVPASNQRRYHAAGTRASRALQARSTGNQAIWRLLREKPTLTRPGDASERQAHEPEAKAGAAQRGALGRDASRTSSKPGLVALLGEPGHPLPKALRNEYAAHLGSDSERVRLHTGAAADAVAHVLGARAFTRGTDVAFRAGELAPNTPGGRDLLEHELAHVGQRNTSPAALSGGTIARAVSPHYDVIEDQLSYGIIDWAITDADARYVLDILNMLDERDLKDTVHRMEIDGYDQRLLDNISDEDETRYAKLIEAINQARGESSIAQHIEELTSYGLFDWKILDWEAHVALMALTDLRGRPDKLKSVIAILKETHYRRFLENLSERDRRENRAFIIEIEAIRATGTTHAEARAEMEAYKAMSLQERRALFERDYPTGRLARIIKAVSPDAAAHDFPDELGQILRWVQEEETLKAVGMTQAELVKLQADIAAERDEKLAKKIRKEEAKEKGEPVPTTPLTPGERTRARRESVKTGAIKKYSDEELEEKKKKREKYKAKLKKRADAVIKELTAIAKRDYPELRVTERQFRFDPDSIEEHGRHVFAHTGHLPDGTRVAVFGMRFLETAEVNPKYVMDTVVHELFGHAEYGSKSETYMFELYEEAMAMLPGYVRPTGKQRKEEKDTFGYQGTEIYALLRSEPYYTSPTYRDWEKGVRYGPPHFGVEPRLRVIKEHWHPTVAFALVRGIYKRLLVDPRITAAALEHFRASVRKVFGSSAASILR